MFKVLFASKLILVVLFILFTAVVLWFITHTYRAANRAARDEADENRVSEHERRRRAVEADIAIQELRSRNNNNNKDK